MDNRIVLRTWTGRESLSLEGNVLYLDRMGKTAAIPVSQVVSFEIKDPKSKMRPGMITIRLSGSSDSMVRLTSVLSLGGSNNIEFPHGYEYADAAYKMQRKIAEYSAPTFKESRNDIDDLRKLKALLDDGIITESEFEAKKKQILGL